ncbi:group protein B3 [Seminavis robusta]|uniref:Group protein B3 n=1 Tax=Seminavis robusta TaxID=568900 RepID=A0A9N8HX68_9STRA|nr:group protein B3 [Seminavis robusta]|eukprot:Sro2375_g325340.1 group protein B3 (425) ;mRNA; r:3579-5118
MSEEVHYDVGPPPPPPPPPAHLKEIHNPLDAAKMEQPCHDVEDEHQLPEPEQQQPVHHQHHHPHTHEEEDDLHALTERPSKHDTDDIVEDWQRVPEEEDEHDAKTAHLIKTTQPSTPLEHALTDMLAKKQTHVLRLTNEIQKLKAFISKRKQTYKRKRKEEGAPTRALSAYNIFVQDRFAQLAKENEKALKSTDSDAQLKRVPPANLVASTGNQWKELPAEEKAKYEERAKTDRKRYDEQMARYNPPDRASNRKRNKTGYNMFFSAHVLRLKQSETGVPSERGSVARLVGTAWKALSAEEKQYYEREADKHNGMHPVKDDVEDEEDEERKQQHHHMDPYAHMHPGDMHMHGGMHAPMHGHQPQHDPRHHYPYATHHMYGQGPYGHYDYQHHQQQHHHSRHGQGRSHGGYGHGYPPPQRNPYEGI